MKCELCHQAQAETATQMTVGGEVRELYVCKDCATRRPEASTPATEVRIEVLFDSAFPLPAPHDASKRTEDPCPTCGMTRREYRKRSRLGCATCYAHFSQELAPLLRDMHSGERHVGKVPRQALDSVARERLAAELTEAINHQQYEQAAILRDRLRALASATAAGSPERRGGHA